MNEWRELDTWDPIDDLMHGDYEVQTRVKRSFLNIDYPWITVLFGTSPFLKTKVYLGGTP